MTTTAKPTGELMLRTVARPKDTNTNLDIFGGWIMSQMDLGGGMLAAEIAQGRIVTVAVQEMVFLRPVKVGHIVNVYAHCLKVGNTSMQLKVEVWVKPFTNQQPDLPLEKVTEAVFAFVAIDDNGQPRPIPRENNPRLAHI
ncbi:acyl-CoA thioester hydrolase YciA [Neisseria sp. ZJ106]|uniref:Acyl-CoA thioester hydrolase YciA n=1 Tax=Neisseria lisongii TaxID=2912188 RepID=A0AAW5ADX9_9NEIS|nr:acyl-CoA thioester hydrolase YciA [Neisseria lisongii]MCF7520756.1 acyl-CoA thioester hydrolase YciA [Neisseria lisongii]MCF7529275.1 acyl-CoA thioester hydrolase YciA [Neisseria lisongii]WCL70697.1 acyl-CoA thioester hydrolase YciA [Neisseria lisongii]